MELLTELKIFLLLGCICYMLTILSFIHRHSPTKIMITRTKQPEKPDTSEKKDSEEEKNE